MTRSILRLAVQKSGRLYDDSVSLLTECGITLNVGRGASRLRAEALNFPLEVLFLRDDDIPGYVADGVADVGIVGENVVAEADRSVEIMDPLQFSRCRLSLAVTKGSAYRRPEDLDGRSIATSYPRILRKFLAERSINASIHEISGSVEIAPGIGLADAICDIVSSGSTLVSNGLVELEPIFFSEAVLVAHSRFASSQDAPQEVLEKRRLLEKLRFRIHSVLNAKNRKYIVLNVPDTSLSTVLDLLPGIKSPTVVPLAMEGWSAVHSVVDENEFWERIETLREAGAQGILVVPIEKMIC